MDTDTRAQQAVEFFRTNYGDRKVSLAKATITGRIAGLNQRENPEQKFNEGESRFRIWSMGLEGLIRSMIDKSDKGVEIFYAPTPMSGSKGRKKEQALPNVVVYGDADMGLTTDVHARLVELGACLVRSGGTTEDEHKRPKYHVYLLLTKEVSPEELERLNRGLKTFIRGDKFDATALLRIPGTRNHKYPGAPIVTVERYADARHTPDNLSKFLSVPDDDKHTGGVADGQAPTLPEIPKGFRWTQNKPGYFKLRKVVREWNGRFSDPGQNIHRYGAAIAIVKETIKQGLSVDMAYAFAMECEPLLDKAAEEGGYNIQKDVSRIWRRENFAKPSGDLTAEDIVSAVQAPDVKDKPRTTPAVTSSADLPMPDLGKNFPFQTPNLDELLAGDYKPLEPTLVPCGPYFLLYPGKSHGISSDRGVGKTQVTIAMVYEVMKQGGKVAYFDFEDSPDTFIRDRMMNQFGIPEHMIRNQFLYFHGVAAFDDLDMDDNDSPPPTLTEAVRMLADVLRDWDLVVVDGVTASMADWSVEEDKTKPSNALDGGKATDYTWWYNRQVKPFLEVGLATFQIDHVNKTGGNRVSGTGQKGAKFTGVEYELRADKNGSLVMGGTGKLLLSVAKDRIGRIVRYKKKRPDDEDDVLDVARFTMTSTIDGKITRVGFEPINQEIAGRDEEGNLQGPTLNDKEQRVYDCLVEFNKPMNKSNLIKAAKLHGRVGYPAIDSLKAKGLVDVIKEGTSMMVVLVSGSPTPTKPGERSLDFSLSDRKPKRARRQRECRRCREMVDYPEDFVQPEEIGFQVGRPLCRPCAGENIESESEMPRDGAEWAREIREKRDRRKSTHEEDDLS